MGATGDKIKGKAMQIEGKVTGDKVRMGQGALKEAKGKVESAIKSVGRKVKNAALDAKDEIKARVKRAKPAAKRSMR